MIHIGTSGYSYTYWKNRFYPEKLPASQWLSYYATRFSTLELNNSFYRFPAVASLKRSASLTPEDFTFSVKAHKIITHTKRLVDVKDKIQEFMDIVQEGLGNKLACILYQMPPSYTFSEERLINIVKHLSFDKRNVIEFRHVSWWNQEVYTLLKKHHINFCSVSYPGLPGDNIITGSFLYRRMHGVPELFKSSYSAKELADLYQGLPVKKNAFIYFNNTMFESGYSNAQSLQQMAESS
ncbi:DUF72 domain-containing protein [Niabella aquatica]